MTRLRTSFILLVILVFQLPVLGQYPIADWHSTFSAVGGNIIIKSIDIDSSENIYLSGTFDQDFDADPGSGVTTLYAEVYNANSFLVKLDSSSNFVWAISFSDVSFSEVKIDERQEIVITGYTSDTADLDPGTGVYTVIHPSVIQEAATFILKLNSSAQFVWCKELYYMNGTATLLPNIEIDVFGNIFLIGLFSTTVDMDPSANTHLIIPSDTLDGFITKVDEDGNFIWCKTFSGAGRKHIIDVKINYSNEICIWGLFNNTIDLDPDSGSVIISTLDGEDPFILMLDTGGNYKNHVHFNDSEVDQLHSFEVDNLNNIIVGIRFRDSADIDPGQAVDMYYAGTTIFTNLATGILKLDSNLNYVSHMLIRNIFLSAPFITGIETDSNGNIFIAGITDGACDFDPSSQSFFCTSNGYADVFICKYSPLLKFIWGHWIGGINNETFPVIATAQSGNTYFSGSFISPIMDMEPGTGNSYVYITGYIDGFLQKIPNIYCNEVYLSFDSVIDVSCMQQGFASVSIVNNTTPFNYQWNNFTNSIDSFAYFDYRGIYTLNATDSTGCMLSKDILIGGPDTLNGIDVSINLAFSEFRSGFPSRIDVIGTNNSCIPASGNMKLVFDTLLQYVASTPPPDSINGNTLIWNYTNLFFDNQPVTATVDFLTTGAIGDFIDLEAEIFTTGVDADTANNDKEYSLPLIMAYDPNDKLVYPTGDCIQGFIETDQPLTYTIRFQNTGNAEAIHVYLIDSIDPNLDFSTMRIIASSHDMVTRLVSSNVIEFRFDSIMLPDSTTNLQMSNGYVIYEIIPNPSLMPGQPLKNKAYIYFDFNLPIITNQTLNTIMSVPLDTSVIISPDQITLTASQSNLSYQWMDCSTGLPIPNEISQQFTVTSNGYYSVIISDGCYSDTSRCIPVTSVGYSSHEPNEIQFTLSPNPVTDWLNIKSTENQNYRIYNSLGQVVLTFTEFYTGTVYLGNLPSGVYTISTENGQSRLFVKID